MASTVSDEFLTRRVPLLGRRLLIRAPAGDYAFSRYTRGRGFRGYATLCRGVLRPDSVVLDVGANIGLTALIAAQIASRGRILAVEGAPRNHAALARNLAEHAAGIAEPIHCAVGASAGRAHFVDNSAFGHVQSAGTLVAVPPTVVRQTTIDAIVAERGLPGLDLIKLDIEGFEQDALEGAHETLARFDPVVFLEFNVWCQIALYDRNPRRFLDWLLAAFPELYVWREERLISIREIGPLEFLRSNMIEQRCNDDLVAVRDPQRLGALRTVARGLGRFFTRRS